MLYRLKEVLLPLWEGLLVSTGRYGRISTREARDIGRLVFVCTGNICRSPFAEYVARHHGFPAASCGIDTQSGNPINPDALAAAERVSINMDSHQTTRWQELDVGPGDLILVMQFQHLRSVREKARQAGCKVSLLGSYLSSYKTIEDPYQRAPIEFDKVFLQIETAVGRACLDVASAKCAAASHLGVHAASAYGFDIFQKILKECLGRVAVAVGLHTLALKGNAVIVAFHSIVGGRSAGALRTSAEDFAAYCHFFRKNFNCKKYSEISSSLKTGEKFNKSLSISFDDGYADNAEFAEPILRKHGLSAAFFISTGFIDGKSSSPWDEKIGVKSRWMTWAQVNRLSKLGHEIGSHTASHAQLWNLPDDRANEEIQSPKLEIKSRLGVDAVHFALPYGRPFDGIEKSRESAKKIGYLSYALCRGGVVSEQASPYHLERWPINPRLYLSPYGWMFDVIRASIGKAVS